MDYGVNDGLSLEEKQQKGLQLFLEAMGADNWEYVASLEVQGDGVPTLKPAIRKFIESPNSMAYKLIMTFPGVSVDQAWEVMSNWTKRKGYDARLANTEILDED